MKISRNLILASLGGGVLCFGIAQLYKRKVSDDIKNSLLYKEAMEAVKQNKGVIYYLGLPLKEHMAYFTNSGFTFSNSSNVEVLVSGPKSHGKVFISVVKDKNDENSNNLLLDTIQLQIGKDNSRRLVIKKSLTENNSESYV